RNKGAKKQRFTIKWNAKWRRKNYDLHNVMGFYAIWIILILAFTGLVWGFQWFSEALYQATGGEKSLEYIEPVSDMSNREKAANMPALDQAWEKMKTLYPNAEVIEVHPPATPESPIAANANPDAATYCQIDYRHFDRYNLNELSVDHIYGRFPEADIADKIRRMNYDIHVGAILGLPGKILAFFASLIAASLPVTGFLIWRGRRKKDNRKKKSDSKSSTKRKQVKSSQEPLAEESAPKEMASPVCYVNSPEIRDEFK